MYDFDPLRVRREICDRTHADLDTASSSPKAKRRLSLPRRFSGVEEPKIDGTRDKTVLVTLPCEIKKNKLLPEGLKTGEKLPYMYAERACRGDVALIDGERIVAVGVSGSVIDTVLG